LSKTQTKIVCPYSVGKGVGTLQTSSFGQFIKQKGLILISNNEMVHRYRAALELGNKHKNIARRYSTEQKINTANPHLEYL
jgi:hypothetical protein